MGDFLGTIVGLFLGLIIGFVSGMVLMSGLDDFKTALKISNVMNATMLDCVTHKIITQEQVHDIETVFHKHIEINFKRVKASHCDNCKNNKE